MNESHYQEKAPLLFAWVEDEAIGVAYLSDVWSFSRYFLTDNIKFDLDDEILYLVDRIKIKHELKSIFMICDKSDWNRANEMGCYRDANVYYLPSLESVKIQVENELQNKYICALGAITLIMDKNNTQDLINNTIILSKEDMENYYKKMGNYYNIKKICCFCGQECPIYSKTCIRCYEKI